VSAASFAGAAPLAAELAEEARWEEPRAAGHAAALRRAAAREGLASEQPAHLIDEGLLERMALHVDQPTAGSWLIYVESPRRAPAVTELLAARELVQQAVDRAPRSENPIGTRQHDLQSSEPREAWL
jgi:hypothetical protein